MNLRLLAACFLLLVRVCDAQTNDPVQYIGIEHGLSNNAVTSIYQDHNGFMWFGTYDGLNLYDGYTFRVFRNIIGDSSSLGDNHISAIEGDAAHNLWIGCEKGLYIYNPLHSKFRHARFKALATGVFQPILDNVPALCAIGNGRSMLVGTANKGLLVFKGNESQGMQVPLNATKNTTAYTVTAIADDPRNHFAYVFVAGLGLCRYDVGGNLLRLINASVKEADCLKVDTEGNLWMGTDNGLFRYEERNNVFSRNMLPARNRVIQLFEDKKKTIWIASDGGGVWSMPLASQEPKPYLSADGSSAINSNAVYSIYEDNEGRKWIGTLRGGINLIQPFTSSFKTVAYNPPGRANPVNNFILSFCEDQYNNIWIGTDGAGLRYWDRKANRFTSFSHNPADPNSISSDFVTGMFRDSQNDLWISTWFGGVNRLRKNSTSFEHFICYNPKTGAAENNAWLVYEDAQKRLWASTTNNGTLYLFNRSGNRFELFDENIVNIHCVAEDSEGNFWGGNYTSLIRIDRSGKKHITYKIGYTVRCIREDRNKNLWVGTDGGGLLLLNPKNGEFQRFTTADGLPSNSILRLLEDGKHNLWLSTYNGLCKFNTLTRICRNFSQSDGLQSNQFSFNAALALKSGEFLFGGIKGFNVFYPDNVYDKKETPRIFLTGIKINNTSVEDNDSYVSKRDVDKINRVTVPYDQAILSMDFVGLDYTGTDKIKYAYLLEGWDKNWNNVNNVRTANYSRLQEGTYTFKVKVTNSDGVWSNETELLKVVVLPPWYRNWWAYLLYFLVAASAIYVYVHYNKRQERLKYEIKLARLEYEKEKEITEKKISFFTHISHEFRAPLTLIINPLKEIFKGDSEQYERKDISMVYRNARRLLSLVDQLLLFRKAESIDQQLRIELFDIVETCNEVFLSFSQHAHAKNIAFTFEKPDHPIQIYGDKEKIEIILFNLLSNAFKYTARAGAVSLAIGEGENDLAIAVKDNGTGIAAETGNKIFNSFYQAGNSQTGFGVGLYVSNKLAIAHGGRLSYSSKLGEGTEFCLTVLKGDCHFQKGRAVARAKESPSILQELVQPVEENGREKTFMDNESSVIDKLRSNLPTMVVVDDDPDIRDYLKKIFAEKFNVYEAEDGSDGYELVTKETPDIVISDVMMKKTGGIELCKKIKENTSLGHIPVILLTAGTSDERKLQGIEVGAEDYIMKPFDRDILFARVQSILKGKSRLQQYFFDSVTLNPTANIPGEHKEFIDTCISIVDAHIDDDQFTVETLCREIGMSHSMLYKKVKRISGLTVNVFIRYIRLRKAAELLLTSEKTITEVTYIVGFSDVKYFREQFFKLFQMNPSAFVKKYRNALGSKSVKANPANK